MKKTIAVFSALLVIVASLTGCGRASGSRSVVDNGYYYEEGYYETAYEAPSMAAYAEEYGYRADEAVSDAVDTDVPADMGDVKIIYTADISMEATEFDEAVGAIASLTEACGGYYEYSSMSDSGSYRSASFTVRIPADQYRSFLDRAGTLCHVTRQEETAEDVSEAYYDTAGRLETQRAKLSRLRQLLAEAEYMEDIIVIENEISETEYMIDRLSGALRHYDALVSYSTVNVYLREVKVLTELPEIDESFGTRLASSFRRGLADFGEFLGDVVIALAYGWLWIVLIVIVIAVIVLLTRKKRRERRERRKNAPAAPFSPAAYSVPSPEKRPKTDEETE